jgi:UDP-glucose 6-dehydrogenase
VWLFEAKKNDPNKIIGAVAQVNESYNKWFVSNIKNKQLGGINWNEFTIYKKIITFGGENHPLATDQTRDYLYLSLLANGEALWY